MITIDKLEAFGCNTNEGLQRCMNNADFYLMLVNKILDDKNITELNAAIKNKDLQKAFEVAHALKGVYGNLSITPLYIAISEMVELLRNKTNIDYQPYLEKINDLFAEFRSLAI